MEPSLAKEYCFARENLIFHLEATTRVEWMIKFICTSNGNWIARVASNAALHITYVCIKNWLDFFFSFFQTTTSQNARFVNVWIACSVFTSAPTVHSTQCALIFVTRIRFWLILGLICIEVNEKNASQWAEKITHQNVRYQRYSDGFPLCRPLFCGYDICSMDLA